MATIFVFKFRKKQIEICKMFEDFRFVQNSSFYYRCTTVDFRNVSDWKCSATFLYLQCSDRLLFVCFFTIPFFIHSLYLCHIHISPFDTGIRCTQCNTNTNTHTAYMWKILQLLCKVKKEQQIFFSLFSQVFCTFSIHTHSYSIFDNNIFVLLSNEQ